ncbi:hypothetical protein [Lactobacillus paraplantarum] [Lactiplantibacillus mudanjiangensis]|uniref:hypothetical protein n=1 Tax=Lactiplantibacillus mudanjiangensis TaxID=1296538 RepID=UPI001013EE23|nr:hypothetical protein [Lactiplantibacillus mudanjiangensis]VDG32255.1 hypothetical protein [Lactobacillus paraplantarum] [Lactiplantibacillus mudanjiangensis]
MYKYLFSRLVRRPGFYFAILLGSLITLAQVPEILNIGNRLQTSLYTHWIESFTGSPLPQIYWMVFPLLVAIPFASILRSDQKNNYFYLIQVQGHSKKYMNRAFIMNFLVGGTVGTIPLMLNFYILATILPAIKPNLVLDGDGNITINKMSLTIFPDLYYSHPLIHVFLFLFIAFLVGGLLAALAFSIGMWTRSVFVTVSSSFILIYMARFFIPLSDDIWGSSVIPTTYANQTGMIHGISFPLIVFSYAIFMTLTLLIFMRGRRRYAI